jgi:hypothetical protein
VKVLNVNWTAATDGGDGLIVANIVGTWIAPAGLVPVAVTARG